MPLPRFFNPVADVGPSPPEPNYFSRQVVAARRFHLNPDLAKQAPLRVVSGGLEHCSPDYLVERTTVPFHTVELVMRGRGEVVLRGTLHPIVPGSLFVYGPNVPHRMSTAANEPLEKYFIAFCGPRALPLLKECGLPPGSIHRLRSIAHVEQVFNATIDQCLSDRRDRPRVAAVALEYLLLQASGEALPHAENGEAAFLTYERCRHYIEEQFAGIRTLEDVGAACHVNVPYMCRLFRRFGRESPYAFLQHLKMNHCAELLLRTSRPVKDIATVVGFTDQFVFSRSFKRVTGLAPGEFRKVGSAESATEGQRR